MKKNAYMAPEMETVELVEKDNLLQNGSVNSGAGGGWSPNPPPGKGNSSRSYDDED